MIGRNDFAVVDAVLLAVVEHQTSALVSDDLTRPIGRRPGRTAPGGPADGLGREVIDRHGHVF